MSLRTRLAHLELFGPDDEAPVLIVQFVDRDGNVTSEQQHALTLEQRALLNLPPVIHVCMDLSDRGDPDTV